MRHRTANRLPVTHLMGWWRSSRCGRRLQSVRGSCPSSWALLKGRPVTLSLVAPAAPPDVHRHNLMHSEADACCNPFDYVAVLSPSLSRYGTICLLTLKTRMMDWFWWAAGPFYPTSLVYSSLPCCLKMQGHQHWPWVHFNGGGVFHIGMDRQLVCRGGSLKREADRLAVPLWVLELWWLLLFVGAHSGCLDSPREVNANEWTEDKGWFNTGPHSNTPFCWVFSETATCVFLWWVKCGFRCLPSAVLTQPYRKGSEALRSPGGTVQYRSIIRTHICTFPLRYQARWGWAERCHVLVGWENFYTISLNLFGFEGLPWCC